MNARPEARAPVVAPDRERLSKEREPLWRQFDPAWYIGRYQSGTMQMKATGVADAEAFYMEQGRKLGHSPNMFFDERWYLATYQDIAAHLAAGGVRSGFEHYCSDGYRDRSPHWLFDQAYYLSCNVDVTRGLMDRLGLANGYDHYLTIGDGEFRSGHQFFDADLFQQNDNQEDAGTARSLGPFMRFLADDCRAGSTTRVSWYFDPAWYLESYPEIIGEIEKGWWLCALQHFFCNRTPQRYSGLEWFSEAFYGRTYPDVLVAVMDGSFRNGYEHFLTHGVAERRKPHADVDLVQYFLSWRVRAEIARGDFGDPFAHWLAHRIVTEVVEPVREIQSKRLMVRTAETMLPQFARTQLEFGFEGEPAVSVILVMHNQFALTMMALASLRSGYRGGIELILVDSGSRDDTRHIARYVAGATILRIDHNAGFVEACNMALARVHATVTLYLNNDLTLGIHAVELARSRLLRDETVGAVGGKVIRTNGMLQEAGSIVWRDGSTAGYLRDADPNCAEANFVRDVDFCSGAFLMVRTGLLKRIGGFDDDYRPAYYEETDLCIRLRKQGYRIVYDPAIVVQHVEYGSSGSLQPERMIARNRKTFVTKHLDWLRYQHPPRLRNALFARSPRPRRGRILFIEDQIPLRGLGSGYVRSNDIICTMASLGYQVSVFPIYAAIASLVEILHEFPETVELLYDRGMEQLPGFIAERAGFYDIVWIGRTHNLERLLPILGDASSSLPERGLVLDSEAVGAPRSIGQALLLGRPPAETLERMLRREFSCAYFCQRIIAVNERDAALIRLAGHDNVSILGHMKQAAPTPAAWRDRSGLLFLGAIHEAGSPNHDSLEWFVAAVLPLLATRLSADVRFTIAGHLGQKVDMSKFGRDRRVDLLGPTDDVAGLYGSHRIFVAPTRFAGGIPFKIHEAAAHGLPVVASELLCRQVGWTDREDILSGGDNDAVRFADAVVELYGDPGLWMMVRSAALLRIETENSPASYLRQLGGILAEVVAEKDKFRDAGPEQGQP